ncbi:hypothetical protein [Candidatus Methanocrinis natronophilus]|uniref:Uncharacterized protein n=1 Tax=Candidatus Methanocrinis natronophilus TaxID=3033396 RepID=A0ABT5X5P9_9EURY|nr:hypothetical protein [Candidatus Methanocrinis natronophilus]MDF0590025.1 hypothetical protein [Candidatus Methanocrinis natronophilus]
MRKIEAKEAATAPKKKVASGLRYCQRAPARSPEAMAAVPTAPW